MRLIDLDILMHDLCNRNDFETTMSEIYGKALEVSRDQPLVDAEPVRHGHWLTWEGRFPGRKVTRKNNLGVFCSACDGHSDIEYDYCPSCGAKMDGEKLSDAEAFVQSLDEPIENWDLSVRSFNCLYRAGLRTAGSICEKRMDELAQVRNLGRKSLEEVVGKIHAHGLKLKGE